MRWLAALSWGVLIFFALPLVVVIVAAFTDANYVAFPPAKFGVKWFGLAFEKPDFSTGLSLSLRLALCASVLSTALAAVTTGALVRMRPRASRLGVSFFSLPVMVPVMLIGFSTLQLLAVLGLGRNFWGLLLGHLVLTMPFAMRILYSAFSSFDRSLELAAYTLGTGYIRTALRVTLPTIFPAVVASLSLTFLLSFDDVVVAVFLSAPTVRTLPVVIFNHLDQSLSPDLLAVSAIIIAVSIVMILIVERSVGLGKVFGMKGFERQAPG